ncbi:hypothetical protein [Streptomyces niveus]|uniref:hypothetical protein n=1 Tax=Streptomyces niveus TaxID=193462 RepID=UPI00386A3E96
MSNEMLALFAIAVTRLGGELRVTADEWTAFEADEHKLKFDFPSGGDTVVTVSGNDLPDGVASRLTTKDGLTYTTLEEDA